MTKWHWDEAARVSRGGYTIEIVDDGDYTHASVIIECPEELRALIKRLEELAKELGWNNDDQG